MNTKCLLQQRLGVLDVPWCRSSRVRVPTLRTVSARSASSERVTDLRQTLELIPLTLLQPGKRSGSNLKMLQRRGRKQGQAIQRRSCAFHSAHSEGSHFHGNRAMAIMRSHPTARRMWHDPLAFAAATQKEAYHRDLIKEAVNTHTALKNVVEQYLSGNKMAPVQAPEDMFGRFGVASVFARLS